MGDDAARSPAATPRHSVSIMEGRCLQILTEEKKRKK
jgi:hypothetical protein